MIQRLSELPQAVSLPRGQTLYCVELSALPSAVWREAFLHPPTVLTRRRYTPELGSLELAGARVSFRTTPEHLHMWLRRLIGGWRTPTRWSTSDRVAIPALVDVATSTGSR